ncbi:hypothetical protein, partial [Streptomyces sp. ADI95-17]|uniref:hypothetical protein n=1 Tax=Streptomyces sp. ADI95-17 TaxID=1522759 RepID=UPI0019D02A66
MPRAEYRKGERNSHSCPIGHCGADDLPVPGRDVRTAAADLAAASGAPTRIVRGVAPSLEAAVTTE